MALSVGLSACGGGGSSTTAMPEPEPTPEPTPDSGAVDLAATQAATMAAAAAAKVASDNAAAAAAGAGSATENLATLQTNAMADGHAMNASAAAEMAMAEYMKAKAASDAAASATTASDAGEQRAIALAAQKAAEDAATKAADYAMKASEAADMELMIDGKDKSVGESMLNAGDGELTSTNDDGETTAITGRQQDDDPMNNVEAKVGQVGVQDNPNTDIDEAKTPMASVAVMDVTIGRTLDSRDDTARMMLVTHYAGSKMVKVFDYAEADTNLQTTGPEGSVTSIGGSATADPLPLTYKGMYYPATGGATNDVAQSLLEGDPADAAAPVFDSVAANAKPQRVYSYEDPTDGTTYVVVASSSTTTGEDPEYTYREVDVTVSLPAVGTDATEIRLPAKEASVMADLATPKAYDHIHFGVWAGLKDNEDGDNSAIADLGIGFVQSVGDGMTENMPNHKSATYSGNWVATVQGASEGAISLEHGPASLTANLDKSTLTAILSGLATLSGAIDGNTFSGTKADVEDDDPHGLNSGGTFSGGFSGGFYGDMAAEAGGVFDFTSDDIADGAFRGAFGADRKDDE